jgi:uncharacterized glyoxalase superfamily protein PhnB
MADAFDVLRTPPSPVAPDPEFARRLRARIERALSLPKGVTVSNLQLDLDLSDDLATETGASVSGTPTTPVTTRATLTPYLAVSGAAAAIEWYKTAFGAQLRSAPILMPDGRVGHAEIEIGGALIMLADEFPEIGHTAPTQDLGVHVTLHLSVEDVDRVIGSAVAAGADLERPASDQEYGRNGTVRDPFGHRWLISQEVSSEPEPPADPETVSGFRQGDIGYVSLWMPDAGRGASFFSSVLGWEFAPGAEGRSRQVQGLRLHHGMWGGVEPATLFCCFAVEDMHAALERVRGAGGTPGEPEVEPFGTVAQCTDDQGVQFAVFVPPGGVRRSVGPREAAESTGGARGELSYITMEVPDSARTRAFYGSVLGWGFTPGRVGDGWQVQDVVPMVGVSGGHDHATTVPLYEVDNIDVAVERVRAAGGTATPPEVQPYGTTSNCTDDQGTRFYLGQF